MSDFDTHESQGPFHVNDNPEPLKGSHRYEVINANGDVVNSFVKARLSMKYADWLNSDRKGKIF